MTREKLIDIVSDRMNDPWTYCAEDVATCDPIGIEEATGWLDEYREQDKDLEPEDRLPEEVTPEIIMTVWNCTIRKARHDLQIERLSDIIQNDEEREC